MDSDATFKIAGPIQIEKSVLVRDSLIREDNDGPRIDDADVREYVNRNKEQIFAAQNVFFAELRRKQDELAP
jgi:hypothetical protein